MAEPKTKKTKASVSKFISGIEDEQKRKDSEELVKIFEEVTGEKAVMWGSSIIGFGEYHYKYKSKREGDWPLAGFSPRKQNLSIYIMAGFKDYADILKKIGKHKHSVSCLYIKRLSDIDVKLLKKMIKSSVAKIKKIYS